MWRTTTTTYLLIHLGFPDKKQANEYKSKGKKTLAFSLRLRRMKWCGQNRNIPEIKFQQKVIFLSRSFRPFFCWPNWSLASCWTRVGCKIKSCNKQLWYFTTERKMKGIFPTTKCRKDTLNILKNNASSNWQFVIRKYTIHNVWPMKK